MFGCHSEHRNTRHDSEIHHVAVTRDIRQTEAMIAFAGRKLGITGRQREAWERLADAMRDSAEAMQIARAAVDDAEEQTLVRMTRFEDVVFVAAAAARRVRPALEALYRMLDDAQRGTLDELVSRGPGRRFVTGL